MASQPQPSVAEDIWAPLLEQARVLLDAEAEASAPVRRPAWALPAAGAIGGLAATILLVLTPFLIVPALPRARFGALPWLVTPPRRLAARPATRQK